MSELIINTEGWNEVVCDKCGSCTSFAPDVKLEDMFCLGCMPETPPQETQP